MLRRGRWTSPALAVLLTTAAAMLGACGDDDKGRPLSAGRASELRSTLGQVEQSVAAGDCDAASAQAQTLEQEASDLPQGVNSDLRRALRSSAQRLGTLIEQNCGATGATGPTTPSGATTETSPDEGTTGGDEQPGKQKEKKPKKDKGKGNDEQTTPVEPPPDEQSSPDTGGSGDGGSGGIQP